MQLLFRYLKKRDKLKVCMGTASLTLRKATVAMSNLRNGRVALSIVGVYIHSDVIQYDISFPLSVNYFSFKKLQLDNIKLLVECI